MQNNSKKRNISTILILAIVLLVPGFLYIVLNKIGSNEYVKLPIYGEKVLSGKMVRKMGREMPDTVFHQIQPKEFIAADSSKVMFLGQDSTIVIAHLFHPKDEGLSQSMLQSLRKVVDRHKLNHKVRFFSISIDSTTTIADLQKVAKKYTKGLESSWQIVASRNDNTAYFRSQLLLDAMINPNDPADYLISNNYILIDSERRIRGFYDINLKTETDRLQDEIKVQMVEELRNNPLKIEKK